MDEADQSVKEIDLIHSRGIVPRWNRKIHRDPNHSQSNGDGRTQEEKRLVPMKREELTVPCAGITDLAKSLCCFFARAI